MIYNRVYARVDLDAISHNVGAMKNNLAAGSKMIAVIKTNGYGHGAVPIAKHIEHKDIIEGFAVATAQEALSLRRHGIKKKILILGAYFENELEELIQNDIRMNIFQVEIANKIQKAAKKLGKKAFVHVKVDTAMSRLGIRPSQEDSISIVKEITKMDSIHIEGIFTHFSKADEADKANSHKQMELFQNYIDKLGEEGIRFEIIHASNSAGIIDLKEYHYDCVRAGISLYGLYPSDEVNQNAVKLKPAMSLHSQLVYVKEVEEGTCVGYGGTFKTTHKTKIGTVPVGYGDGYPRTLSNKGVVLIHGKEVPIIGRICMDQFMVDLTDLEDVSQGDEVVLFGQSGDTFLPIERLSDLCGRFDYEFVCDLGMRIPRVYTSNQKIVGMKDWFNE